MKNAVALQVGKGVTSAMVTERPWNSWEPGNETSPRALLGLAYLSRLLKAFLSRSLYLFVLEIFLFFIFICVSHESIYTHKDLVHLPWPLAKSLCKSILNYEYLKHLKMLMNVRKWKFLYILHAVLGPCLGMSLGTTGSRRASKLVPVFFLSIMFCFFVEICTNLCKSTPE